LFCLPADSEPARIENPALLRSKLLAESLRRCYAVPDSRTTSTYNEPTVMWRMQREHGLVMYAVIAPTRRGASVGWFVNGRLLGMREFDDWTGAIAWSDRIREQNWTVGWRLTPDDQA
jgi:hypothetical protein